MAAAGDRPRLRLWQTVIVTACALYLCTILRQDGQADSAMAVPDAAAGQSLRRELVGSARPTKKKSSSRREYQDFVPDKTQRLLIGTAEFNSGGPEALIQLALAARENGMNVLRQRPIDPVLVELYPDITDIPMMTKLAELQPGETYVFPEITPCGQAPPGVREAKWLLARRGHRPHDKCTAIHHVSKLARESHSPLASVLMPYLHTNRTGFRKGAYRPEDKANVVCVDGDEHGPELVKLVETCGLREILPGGILEVHLLKGLSHADLHDLYRRCKVVMDTNAAGMERVPLEAVSYGAVPIFDSRGVDMVSDWLDWPIPQEYILLSNYRGEVLRDKLFTALTEYENDTRKFDALRERIRSMRSQFVRAVGKLFGGAALFVIPCTVPEEDGARCLRAAISILLFRPLAQVRIVTPRGGASLAAGEQTAIADLHQVLLDSNMAALVSVVAAGDDDEETAEALLKTAPNHRIVLVPPDSVMLNEGPFMPGGLDCKVWALPSVSEDVVTAFVAGKSRICQAEGSSFASTRRIEDGDYSLDLSEIQRFSWLCSSAVWQAAVKASSPALAGFCASVAQANR